MDPLASTGRKIVVGLLRLVFVSTMMRSLPVQIEQEVVPDAEYDFVVVGSGAGGSTVAGRLSEVGAQVLVLEAGGSAPPESIVPAFTGMLFGEDDWGLLTEPQTTTQMAYENRRVPVPVAKVLGGCTSMNGLHYVRGSRADFDRWAAFGNTGWDYQSVLPYFKKSENFEGFQTNYTKQYHGFGGPVNVKLASVSTPVKEAFVKAAHEFGSDFIDDSGPSQIGFSPAHFTVKDGIRVSTSEAFLRPNLHRKNLFVRTNAFVIKVLFDSKKRAVGVVYDFNGKRRVVKARKEVILSCGAIHTPQLLMLSGVGPADHLAEMSIPVVVPLPGVGQHLHDHHSVNGLLWGTKKGSAISITDLAKPFDFARYITKKRGFYSHTIHAAGFIWQNLSGDDSEWPDVGAVVSPMTMAADMGIFTSIIANFNQTAFRDIFRPYFGRESLSVFLFLTRPKSKGWVKLNSNNPYDGPRINPNFLQHPDDLELLLKGYRMAEQLMQTKPFAELGVKSYAKPISTCRDHKFNSDSYWRCFLRSTVSTFWHFASTCKMAPDSDPMGVVTPKLSLRGVRGVRIVDASVMPEVVTGNPMATTIMIAEKAADLIKADWQYPVDPLPR